jgi:inhibitor of KinA
MPAFKVLPAGDTALVVEFGETIDRQLSRRVLALARRMSEARWDGVIETVPTFRSLMVHYDPLVLPAAALTARIDALVQELQLVEPTSRRWRLPACYDPDLAPDLDDVAARSGLTRAQVVERHSAVSYHVYMLGFLPGQAYMGDLPQELMLGRRDSPRPKIAAGSLAIATSMTCIFPLETPCGWHLIGRSPVALWQQSPCPAALLAPGDQVTFMPVSLREYQALAAQAAAGTLAIAPSEPDLSAQGPSAEGLAAQGLGAAA